MNKQFVRGFFACLASVVLIVSGWTIARGQAAQNQGIASYITGQDACVNSSVIKSQAAINISSATTTQIVALSAGKIIFVCGYNLVATGTTPTIQFETGTSATCGTPTVLTGAMAPTAGTSVSYGGAEMTVMSTPAGDPLCIVSGGTPSIQGVVTYVQQ